mmetsp:Transcript_20136/g.39988  ORF Transcript_20136/g.39988 Transcript_20136/m.39988 type:complete len:378 (+) Transcript_20136:200-1333(+)
MSTNGGTSGGGGSGGGGVTAGGVGGGGGPREESSDGGGSGADRKDYASMSRALQAQASANEGFSSSNKLSALSAGSVENLRAAACGVGADGGGAFGQEGGQAGGGEGEGGGGCSCGGGDNPDITPEVMNTAVRVPRSAKCAFCVEGDVDTQLRPCAHLFHGRCLKPWLQASAGPPRCLQCQTLISNCVLAITTTDDEDSGGGGNDGSNLSPPAPPGSSHQLPLQEPQQRWQGQRRVQQEVGSDEERATAEAVAGIIHMATGGAEAAAGTGAAAAPAVPASASPTPAVMAEQSVDGVGSSGGAGGDAAGDAVLPRTAAAGAPIQPAAQPAGGPEASTNEGEDGVGYEEDEAVGVPPPQKNDADDDDGVEAEDAPTIDI